MSIADKFNECAQLGNDYFTVTGAEKFNKKTQLLACWVACTHGQAVVHVHFARIGNGIETGCNIREISNTIGTWDFGPGSGLANACIAYAKSNSSSLGFPF